MTEAARVRSSFDFKRKIFLSTEQKENLSKISSVKIGDRPNEKEVLKVLRKIKKFKSLFSLTDLHDPSYNVTIKQLK